MYLCARGLGGISVEEMAASEWAELEQPADLRDLLDFELVKRTLAHDPFDRPDCFELTRALDGRSSWWNQ